MMLPSKLMLTGMVPFLWGHNGVNAFHMQMNMNMNNAINMNNAVNNNMNNNAVNPAPQDLTGSSLFEDVQQPLYRRQKTQKPTSAGPSTTAPPELGIEIKRPATFVSPPFRCYIEDTDSNGVMNHANYLQVYDRALHSMFMLNDNNLANVLETCTNMMPDGADVGGLKREKSDQDMLVESYSDWSIVNVEHQRFRTSPKLGSSYFVHGTLVDQPKVDSEVWDVCLRESWDPNSPMFNFARVTISRPGVYIPPDNIVSDYGLENEDSVTSTKEVFWLYRDEFDAHPTNLPLRNALNLFERSRANFVGGPEALQTLKEEHGIIFALSSINDMCKFPAGVNGEDADLSPGQLVIIQTDFEVQRQGMILECHQTLLADDRPVAQASVTLMTLNAETFEPTNDLPDWLMEILIYGPQAAQPPQKLAFEKSGAPRISPAPHTSPTDLD